MLRIELCPSLSTVQLSAHTSCVSRPVFRRKPTGTRSDPYCRTSSFDTCTVASRLPLTHHMRQLLQDSMWEEGTRYPEPTNEISITSFEPAGAKFCCGSPCRIQQTCTWFTRMHLLYISSSTAFTFFLGGVSPVICHLLYAYCPHIFPSFLT